MLLIVNITAATLVCFFFRSLTSQTNCYSECYKKKMKGQTTSYAIASTTGLVVDNNKTMPHRYGGIAT